nr:reverse transcriptase domain-containing protein [Tanacetum cinerariifolium]
MLRNYHGHNLSKASIIKIFYHGLSEITQEVLSVTGGGNSNSDTDKIMARMDAMTIKMDARYKELQSHAKKTTPDLDDDDMPMSSKLLYSIVGILLEEEIFFEFDEFMEMTVDENSESESDTKEPPLEKITINTDYKIKTSLEEPPMDLELKPLPKNLEYVFLEEPSFLHVIISSKLSAQYKNKLVSVLKKHKEALARKTIDILGICPSFCKHKIQVLDDKKPVVQKQRRLNPKIQVVVKKEIVRLLVVTNENDELVPTRTITGWRHCKDAHLVLNWERCHFMVKEGVMLRQKVSDVRLEVDKAKINVISRLPPPTNIKDLKELAEYKESLENSSKEIATLNSNLEKKGPPHDSDIFAPILSTKEPEYSPSMGYEHSNTTSETESNEIIKSGVEELVPIPSENEVTLEDKKECDMPVCENSLIRDDHSEIFSDSNNDDDISVYDDDFEDIDINHLIANIESLNDNPNLDRVLNSSVLIPTFEESNNSLSDNFLPEFETFCDHTEETRSDADDSLPKYDTFCFEIGPDQERLINVVKNDISNGSTRDPLLEEADLFLASDNSIPPGIENFADDSERDIRFLEALLIDDSISINESHDSDFDNLSFPRPPPEPPDAEFNAGDEISVVMNDKFECLRDEFDDDDYYSFMFVIYATVFFSLR